MCLVEILPEARASAPLMLDILELGRARPASTSPSQKPKLQPACYMPAAEGMEVLERHERARRARRATTCRSSCSSTTRSTAPSATRPASASCRTTGSSTSKTQKRMRDEPVHKPKGVVFGPTIVYDGERCVMCTRCIRFMDEVAKDPVLDMRERGNLNEIIVAPGPPARRALHVHDRARLPGRRAHDARTSASRRASGSCAPRRRVCQGCATGCNAHLDYDPRNNKAYRYRPRDNEKVNKFWMCDEGMLTYKRGARAGASSRRRSAARDVEPAAALDEVKKLFDGRRRRSRSASCSRAQHSLEDNWALRELGARAHRHEERLLRRGTRRRLRGHDPHPPRQEPEHARASRSSRPGAKPLRRRSSTTSSPGRVTHVIALGGAGARSTPTALRAGQGRDHRGARRAADRAARRSAAGDVVGRAVGHVRERQGHAAGQPRRRSSRRARASPAWEQVSPTSRAALGYEPSWTKLEADPRAARRRAPRPRRAAAARSPRRASDGGHDR